MAKELILVDTNILIDSYRGDKTAKQHLEAIRGRIAVSVITEWNFTKAAVQKKEKLSWLNNLRHIIL